MSQESASTQESLPESTPFSDDDNFEEDDVNARDFIQIMCSRTAFYIYTTLAFVMQYLFFLVLDHYLQEPLLGSPSSKGLLSLIFSSFMQVFSSHEEL